MVVHTVLPHCGQNTAYNTRLRRVRSRRPRGRPFKGSRNAKSLRGTHVLIKSWNYGTFGSNLLDVGNRVLGVRLPSTVSRSRIMGIKLEAGVRRLKIDTAGETQLELCTISLVLTGLFDEVYDLITKQKIFGRNRYVGDSSDGESAMDRFRGILALCTM